MKTYVPAFALALMYFAGSAALGNVGLFVVGVFYIVLLVILVALPEHRVRGFLDTDWTRR